MKKESKLTKEWTRYNPREGYEKEMQDIKLFNGDIITMCWPNAGFWNVCQREGNAKYYGNKELNVPIAEYVRLTHNENF